MTTDISDRLGACYTGVLHDVMRSAGLRDFTLPPELRPLFPERSMAGPAFTIEGKAVPGSDAHDTLLAWTGLLSKAPPGTIWVSQPNDHVVAHMGELSAETLKSKGLRGCVVDGLIRDVNFILAIGFQVWSRGSTPRDIVGYWLPSATNAAIRIGDVDIAPGDYLVGVTATGSSGRQSCSPKTSRQKPRPRWRRKVWCEGRFWAGRTLGTHI